LSSSWDPRDRNRRGKSRQNAQERLRPINLQITRVAPVIQLFRRQVAPANDTANRRKGSKLHIARWWKPLRWSLRTLPTRSLCDYDVRTLAIAGRAALHTHNSRQLHY
jgi:hypothetical protein